MPRLNTSPLDIGSLARLRDEAAAKTAELCRLLRNTKVPKQEAALTNGVRLTNRERLVAICLFVTTDFKAEPATAWLLHMKKKQFPGIAAATWTEAAEEAILEATDEELAMHVPPIAPGHASAVKEACRWQQGWKTAAWVAGLNAEHGLAPSTRSVVEKARSPAGPAGLHGAESVTAPAAPVPLPLRVWGTRWRSRFHAGLGKFSAHDQPTVSELQSKVGPGQNVVAPKPAFGVPKNEILAEKRPEKRGRFPASKKGPRTLF